jgi:hypothetical protein
MEFQFLGQDPEFRGDHLPPHPLAAAMDTDNCIGSGVGGHQELFYISAFEAAS